MAKVRQVTFAVKGSGSGGAGWIGRVDGPDGKAGVYFAHSQEYVTTEDHMINALLKSGVAQILYEEEVEESEAVGAPSGLVKNDENGNPNSLQSMTLLELKLLAKARGVALTSKINTKAKVIKAIEESTSPEIPD